MVCDSQCVDIEVDPTYCGSNACVGGTCVSQRYIGSLQTTTGRWNFGGTVDIAGAEQACQTLYGAPSATICTFPHLLDAQQEQELINATDDVGNAVTSWFILDVTKNIQRQCTKLNGENIPWTYPTADLGEGAVYVDLNAAAGTITSLLDAPASTVTGCGAQRFVPCCLP